MKLHLLLPVLLAPVLAAAQLSPFSITAHIGHLDAPAMAYIDYMDNGKPYQDSAAVVDGVFSFKGSVSGYTAARLSLDHEGKGKQFSIYAPDADVLYFYFGPEKIMLGATDSLLNARFSGSKVYEEYVAYNKYIGGSIVDLTKMYQKAYERATPAQQQDSVFMTALNNEQRTLRSNRREQQLVFAKTHPDSFFALVALSEAAGVKVEVDSIQPIYLALNESLRATDMGQELQQRINAASTTALGKPAPAFVQDDVKGHPLALADLKGKVVLLDFWASWCKPCRAENPNMKAQYKLYKDKGFEILSVSLDSDKKPWVEAIEKDGMPWLHVSDLKGWNNEVGRLYGVRAVPACYLIDRNGMIIGTDMRGEALNEKLAQVFAN